MTAPHGHAPEGSPEITAEALASRLGTDTAPMVLDVREPAEFGAWAIPGARNVPLGELTATIPTFDVDREVVVVCASGSRSARAVSSLRAAGVAATNLAGGMLAWAGVYDTAEIDLGAARIVQVRRRGKGCLSYVVGAGGEAFVVDPSLDLEHYLDAAADHGWRITRVLDTHLHADHLSGARALAEVTGASLHLNPADPFDFPYEPLSDGQRIDLGGHVHFGVTAFSTPGHTRGSTVFEVGGRALLTGDTLFLDGVGRPDLADHAAEYARDLYRSLHATVVALPGEAMVLPAHYAEAVTVRPGEVVGAPLDALRRRVPQLAWPEDRFVHWAANRATPRPPHYRDIVRVNRGAEATPQAWRRLEIGPNRCAA
ncbi:MAG TPA: MBL fold metallo-hydrolase [Acidimicrobiales bacterium]|nr:MBL fold metallo-hydrolase [Acidimicrobiales bacterium]